MGSCSSSNQKTIVIKEQSVDLTNTKKTVTTRDAPSTYLNSTEPSLEGECVKALGTSEKISTKGFTKGYNNGYSSSGDSSGDESDDFSNTISPHRGHRKNSSSVDISAVKSSVQAGGDLHSKVVRMVTPWGKPIQDVYDGVHDGKILGSGVSGTVRLVTHKASKVQYAVKTMDLGLICSDAAIDQLKEEIQIMCQLDHPNIVRLEEVYEGFNEIFLVMELCLGGDLFDRLDEQSDYHYTEAQCARLVKQMLSGVRYLHSKHIIHRDLKLENFLFSSTDPDGVLKMIDFGLSKHFTFGQVHHDAVGTPYTVAPEVIRGSYDEKSDIWAIGVISYLLLSGETPFGGVDGENLRVVRDNILRASLVFKPKDIWENVSDLAKSFVQKCLQSDTKLRPTAKRAQRDMWIQTFSKKDANGEVGETRLKANVVKALVQFKEYSDMRKLLCEVLSYTLQPEQIADLRDEFEKLDNGNGEISLGDLKFVLLETAEAGTLGALTESEVEGIFDALRVRKTETKIRWHEFIAAGLSQCIIDERNLTLAFDRLDTDSKGYISFENIMEMLGDSCANKDDLQHMWRDSIRHVNGRMDKISLDQFLLIMKGQALSDPTGSHRRSSMDSHMSPGKSLSSVQEGMPSPQGKIDDDDIHRFVRLSSPDFPSIPMLENGTNAEFEGVQLQIKPKNKLRPDYSRLRSRSLETKRSDALHRSDKESEFLADTEGKIVKPIVGRNRINGTKFEDVVNDENMTPLMVNRALYRQHRELRLAVLDASKRFEEKQKARNYLLPPSLVMRRGSLGPGDKDVPPVLEQMESDTTEDSINNASQRGGRPNRDRRQKTVSDMTGLMSLAL